MALSTPSGPNFAGSWVALRKQGRHLNARFRSPGPRPSDAGSRSRLPDWTRLNSRPDDRGLARKTGQAPGEGSMTFPRPAHFIAALPRRPGASEGKQRTVDATI